MKKKKEQKRGRDRTSKPGSAQDSVRKCAPPVEPSSTEQIKHVPVEPSGSLPAKPPAPIILSPGERLRVAARKARAVEAFIRTRVHGQPEAVHVLGQLAYQVALQEQRPRPLLATFLGPPAVGKTLAAFAFAEAIQTTVLDDPSTGSTQYVDAQRYASSRCDDLWASCGRLVQAAHRHPQTVMIIDEMEKGGTDFLMSWLQVLGNGNVKVSGETVDFSRCVVLFTTNLGHKAYQDAKGGPQAVDLWDLLSQAMRPHEERHYWASPALPRELVSRLSQGFGVQFSELQGQHRAQIVLEALTGGGNGQR